VNEYKVLYLFSGIGGAALGFQDAKQEYRGMVGQFRTLSGIDCDPEACQDFESLTGAHAVQMDLFGRDDYKLFHGQEPAEEWNEVSPTDLLQASGLECPDVVFLSPPCKGFSGLLPSEKSKSEKYQALNRLVIRGLQLTMDAYADNLPAVIMLENVPRITSRGEFLLKQVKSLLGNHGYVFHEGFHDCGEIGGLGQHRKRYLLIARLVEKMPSFIYRPPTKRVKSIGEVLNTVPMPDDPLMGPLHRLPRIQWKTWVRLALIPAGGDWRDLENAGQYQIEYVSRPGGWQIANWDETAGTIVGAARIGHSNGVAAISDPRLPERDNRHPAVYQVHSFNEPGPCVTGTRFGSGAPAIADPRLNLKDGHHVLYRVSPWENPSNTVTGAAGPNNGAISIADPRVTGGYSNKRKVLGWDESATTVTGTPDIQSGAQSVADPRIKCNSRPSLMGVADWDKPISTVTGSVGVSSSNAVGAVADPRLICKPRSGMMGVQDWNQPGKTVIGAGDIHSGATAIADPRIPKDTEVLDPPPVIIALDGTWHRPLTTLELAALQGFPLLMPDGRPLKLAGNSDARWRERIGNAVPPPAAEAIAEEILLTLMMNGSDEWQLSAKGIWVVNDIENALPHPLRN
jgi:site-specific DNA-cytosine methylase